MSAIGAVQMPLFLTEEENQVIKRTLDHVETLRKMPGFEDYQWNRGLIAVAADLWRRLRVMENYERITSRALAELLPFAKENVADWETYSAEMGGEGRPQDHAQRGRAAIERAKELVAQ